MSGVAWETGVVTILAGLDVPESPRQHPATASITAAALRLLAARGSRITRLSGVAGVLLTVSLLTAASGTTPASGEQMIAQTHLDPMPGSAETEPLRVGAVVTADRWSVQTGPVEWHAEDRVAAATYIPIHPPAGWQWALVSVSIENRGDGTADAGLIDVALVSGDLEVSAAQASHHNPAQTIPEALNRIGVPMGGTTRGYVGFLVPNEATDACVVKVTIRAAPDDAAQPVWVACS